jgi:uncharacterized protein YjbI with pentapeptide repeats
MYKIILALLTFSISLIGAEVKLRPELDFRNKDFSQKDLTEMKELKGDTRNAPKDRAHFDGSNMEGVFLHKAGLAAISMKSVNLSKADLSYAGLSLVDLSNADLRGCNFEHSYLNGVDLRGAKLEGAKFKGAMIGLRSGSHLQNGGVQWPEGFDWKNQGMWGPGVNLRKMDLTGAEHGFNIGRMHNGHMPGADISDSNFSRPNHQFYNWDLTGVVAVGTIFSTRAGSAALFNGKDGNFRKAVFKNMHIIKANFINADLTGSDFSGSHIESSTTFKRANLTGVNWKGARYDKSVVWDDGFDPKKAGLTLVK